MTAKRQTAPSRRGDLRRAFLRAKKILPLLITCLALDPSLAAEPSFTYQAAPGYYEKRGQDLIIGFNVRKAGEQFTAARLQFSGSSRWRSLFVPLIESDDLQQTYFEITIDQELQPGPTLVPPKLGIVTKDTLRDLADYWNRVAEKETRPLPEAHILSMKVISQNEYLQITPRIIKVPAAAK